MPPPARAISFIARALQAHLEFMGAVAAINQMGVAIDQAGRDPAAAAIDDLGIYISKRDASAIVQFAKEVRKLWWQRSLPSKRFWPMAGNEMSG
jgi:hypothetical protein